MYVHEHMIVETLFGYFEFISFDMNASPKRIRKANILLIFFYSLQCLQPYQPKYTSSRLITEVKQGRAMSVLGWVTALEHMVMQALFLNFLVYLFSSTNGYLSA